MSFRTCKKLDFFQMKRRLQELGGSLYISVPVSWLRKYNLKKGSEIFLHTDKQGQLSLFPEKGPEEPEKQTVVHYDEFIYRNMIIAYLRGSDVIIIHKTKPFTQKERSDILDYTNRLLNLEIMEESSQRIAIQNLKSDLPIKKMIARMYYLTKNMLDDLIEHYNNNDIKKSIYERDLQVGKYYMATIMQQRAVLTSKWNEDLSFNEVMNLRLLAQKIELIGDTIKKLIGHVTKKDIPNLKFLAKRYEEAYIAHSKKDVEKAQQFWKTEESDKKKVSSNEILVQLYDNIKDISDLVI